MVLVCKFVVDVTCTRVDIKISVKCTNAVINMRMLRLYNSVLNYIKTMYIVKGEKNDKTLTYKGVLMILKLSY